MAINKKLIHFKTKQKFEEELANNNILETSIVFIKDVLLIWTHGRYYYCDDPDLSKYVTKGELDTILNGRSIDVGSAVIVNKATLEIISINPDNLSIYSPDEYEPIGIIAIPASHDVYGTGECGVMALLHSSTETPDTGEYAGDLALSTTHWGGKEVNLSGLGTFDKFPACGLMDALPLESIDREVDSGYLPSTYLGGSGTLHYACPHDQKTKYYSGSRTLGYIPSPYLNDDSRNPDYYKTTSPVSSSNALSDFRGKENTAYLCSLATAQPNWKTDATIENIDGAGYYPAACCCWRYHTIGTNQGDWYLPAAGEFGYAVARCKEIYNALNKIKRWKNKYGTADYLSRSIVWTSTLSIDGKSIGVDWNSLYGSYRPFSLVRSAYDVRPFTRMKLESTPGIYEELNKKVDKVEGKGLSTNDFTNELKTKLESTTNTRVKGNSETEYRTGDVNITKENIGLGNVTNDAQVKRSELGVTVATLDNGKVPSSQLPSYVDDILEYDSLSAFPTTGESGKIYVSLDTNREYRWGGSGYVEISKSLALGETSSTAYSGDKGKATTDKVDSHVGNTSNPHSVTKELVGLGNVDNTSDLDKPVSTATKNAIDSIGLSVIWQAVDIPTTGARWIRIAKTYDENASAIISIYNRWNNRTNSGVLFTFSLMSTDPNESKLTQIGGIDTSFSKVRIVKDSTIYYIEVYYNQLSGGTDTIYISLSSNLGFCYLLTTPTDGFIPEGGSAKEFEFTDGMMANNFKGHLIGTADNALALNGKTANDFTPYKYLDAQTDRHGAYIILSHAYDGILLDGSYFMGTVYINRGNGGMLNYKTVLNVQCGGQYITNIAHYQILSNDSNGKIQGLYKIRYNNTAFIALKISDAPIQYFYVSGLFDSNIVRVIDSDDANVVEVEALSTTPYIDSYAKGVLGNSITWNNLTPDLQLIITSNSAYGVEWDINVADPHLTRIGNPTLHKTLPIQNNLKGCIAQGNKIMYYLDDDDWKYKKGGNPNKGETELLARLDGYDGTVRVHVPEFYYKSESEGTKRRVWLSTIKIDDSWHKQEEVLVDAYRCTVLNAVPTDMGYLSTLPVNSAISVVNNATYCRGGGNRSDYDSYLSTDSFRTDLNKPRTYITRATMRTYARKAGSELLTYDLYKNIFYWLYVVEYANFNCLEAFNSALTSEGYKQGGLGAGVTILDWNHWSYYNGNYPITRCGYCDTLGNKTGLKAATIKTPTASGGAATLVYNLQVPRWHGFDNPFGDIWTNLDGIIIDADSNNHLNNMNYVYTCKDPSKFAESLNDGYKKVGEEIHTDGYTKLFDLDDDAHIIPNVMGGSTTTYKCDYHWTGEKNAALRTLLVGGSANNGGHAGLGYFNSADGVGGAWTNIGFRSAASLSS